MLSSCCVSRTAQALPLLVLIACGDATSDSPPRDGGVERDGGVCALEVPDDLTVRAGALVPFAASEVGGSAVELSWPGSFVVLGPDEVRAPYDPGTYAVDVRAACGDETQRTITVEALAFGAPIEWTVGPDAREHPAMWIDPAEPDALYLFGGFSFVPRQFTVVDDLWRFDLNAESWTQLDNGGAPLLAAGRVAFVPGLGAYYEGGSGPANELPFSLVEIDASSATTSVRQVSPSGAPNEGATLHGLVYDEPRSRLLSFGGFHPGLTNELFAFDLTTNEYGPIATSGEAPSPRYGFFLAVDEAADRLILFSGGQQAVAGDPVNAATDTWALDLSTTPPTWSQLFGSSDSASGRRNGCSAMDTKNRRFFVWGGTPDGRTTKTQLWILDLDPGQERWHQLPIGNDRVRSSCSAIYDPARERILFGFGNNSAGIFADLTPLAL